MFQRLPGNEKADMNKSEEAKMEFVSFVIIQIQLRPCAELEIAQNELRKLKKKMLRSGNKLRVEVKLELINKIRSNKWKIFGSRKEVIEVWRFVINSTGLPDEQKIENGKKEIRACVLNIAQKSVENFDHFIEGMPNTINLNIAIH